VPPRAPSRCPWNWTTYDLIGRRPTTSSDWSREISAGVMHLKIASAGLEGQPPASGTSPSSGSRPRVFPGPRLIVGLTAIFLIALSASPAGGRELRRSFIRLPSPYTEFFFADPARLPVAMVSNSTQVVPAVIRNREGGTITYHCVTTIGGPTGPVTTRNLVQVANDHAETLLVRLRVGQTGEYQVTIRVEGRPLALAFQVRVNP
jgi:hypothetical protein